MPLTDEERQRAEAAILEDLEREHARRQDAIERKRDRLRSKRDRDQQLQHELEVAHLREELRARYYTERGYKQYIDSRGRESWLSPEEFEWRTKYRRRRKRDRGLWGLLKKALPDLSLPKGRGIWTWVLYAGMLVIAVVLGVALSR
ncbi:MAG: hypothetical protein ABIO70_03630 [Pseudomonadota bacterium]